MIFPFPKVEEFIFKSNKDSTDKTLCSSFRSHEDSILLLWQTAFIPQFSCFSSVVFKFWELFQED